MTSASEKLAGLLAVPFDLLECSWPQPVDIADGRWVSPPVWDAPLMPYRPQPRWDLTEHMPVWTIDWQAFFLDMLQMWRFWHDSGQMRGFQITFRLVSKGSGQLAIWSDDGCIIRKGSSVVVEDRESHRGTRHVLDVAEGDILDVALWQRNGSWWWGAGFLPPAVSAQDAVAILEPSLPYVLSRLKRPEGPAIKMMTDGENPYRTVVAVYSMILNGYAPDRLLLYGDYQWSAGARACFEALLPFATVVPADAVCQRLETLGGAQLVDSALRYWYVMKTCMMVLEAPEEFCAFDDDVLVLDKVDDALRAFRTHDYVFTTDDEFGNAYHRLWHNVFPRSLPIGTGASNVGLSWQRQVHDRTVIAGAMVDVSPDRARAAGEFSDREVWIWEQGLINMLYADRPFWALSSQRYPFIHIDGLPGRDAGLRLRLESVSFRGRSPLGRMVRSPYRSRESRTRAPDPEPSAVAVTSCWVTMELWRKAFQVTIDAYYAGNLKRGADACEALLASYELPADIELQTRRNLAFYASPLNTLLPSIDTWPLHVPMPGAGGLHNPSVANGGDGICLLVWWSPAASGEERRNVTPSTPAERTPSPLLLSLTNDLDIREVLPIQGDFRQQEATNLIGSRLPGGPALVHYASAWWITSSVDDSCGRAP